MGGGTCCDLFEMKPPWTHVSPRVVRLCGLVNYSHSNSDTTPTGGSNAKLHWGNSPRGSWREGNDGCSVSKNRYSGDASRCLPSSRCTWLACSRLLYFSEGWNLGHVCGTSVGVEFVLVFVSLSLSCSLLLLMFWFKKVFLLTGFLFLFLRAQVYRDMNTNSQLWPMFSWDTHLGRPSAPLYFNDLSYRLPASFLDFCT